MIKKNRYQTFLTVIFVSLGLGALVVLIQQLVRRLRNQRKLSSLKTIEFKLSHQGLSTPEVKSRRTDEVIQARLIAEKIAKKERWRKNAFTIFNLTFLVLAISQVLLQDPLGALLTIVTLVLSISINYFQETRAARRVGMLSNQARPLAAVIRDSRMQSIDQDDLVIGDVLVASKGDKILADGVVLESANLSINSSKLANHQEIITKSPGDNLTAGTFCETGWVVYQLKQLNIQIPDQDEPARLITSLRNKTPLQKIIEKILYALLVIVGIFYFILFFELIRIDLLPSDLLVTYREVMSIIFSLLPSGLLLMVVINYAVGSAEIARSDVLVQNSQTIESLAQISTVCFIRHGSAMGLTVELEMLPMPEHTQIFSERRVRMALGNYVHSIPGGQYSLSIIKEHLDGEPHRIRQQARYLSLYGWEAITFSSADMPGCFVIGYPEVLKPYLKPQQPSEGDLSAQSPTQTNKNGLARRLRKWFNRSKHKTTNVIDELSDQPKELKVDLDIVEVDEDQKEDLNAKGIFKGFRQQLTGFFHRKEKNDAQPEMEDLEKINRLMFAYTPTTQPLYQDENYPQCPTDLYPLCLIKFIDEVRPEVKQAVKFFKEEEISIKLLTDGDPINSLVFADQIRLVENEIDETAVMTGEKISQLSQEELQADVAEKTIFAQINSGQKIKVVKALQARGEHVAVIGTSINDLEIMQIADLGITSKGSSPTVLDHADMIVLKDSFNALTDAFEKGQRIVNGVMDVLKLNLTRIAYTLILIIAMYVTGERTFFIIPAQGGTVSVFTVILPSIMLSFWASSSKVDGKNMPRFLFHFIMPAAIVTSLTVFFINFIFKRFGADLAYSQLAVTHLLVLVGLYLVVFVQPPVRFLVAGDDYNGKWQPALVVLVLYVIFNLITLVPLAQRILRIAPLQSLQDYLLIIAISLIWAILVVGIWRLAWPERYLHFGLKPEHDESHKVGINSS
jgi:magnesium-transporting ATPase (P-type)